MEGFLRIPGIKRATLRQANSVRLYLRVVTIADLSDVGGTYIPANMLDGSWQAGSDIKWPYQPIPPKRFWTTFRRCLRLAFCSRTPPYQRASHSMDLDTPLGRWFPLRRNTWFPAYRAQNRVIWRRYECSRLFEMKALGAPGFYRICGELTELPTESYPIRVQQMGNEVWTHKPFLMESTHSEHREAGTVTHCSIKDPRADTVVLGSDGSVRLKEGIATCAWILHVDDSQQMKGYYLLEKMTSLSSYRSELEGMYRGLQQVRTADLQPRLIQQWCDNKAAVDRSNEDFYGPGCMVKPDVDILLALRHTRWELNNTTIICKHVYGHQDTKQRTTPQEEEDWGFGEDWGEQEPQAEIPTRHPNTLNLAARINVECDAIATETAQRAHNGTEINTGNEITLPYQGSRALLNLNGVWVTSKHQHQIRQAKWGESIRQYCMTKHGWSQTTLEMVNWEVVRTIRSKMTQSQFVRSSKLMHGWLPIMHMQAHISGSAQCLGCTCSDETMDHLFQCVNATAAQQRETSLVALRTKGIALGITRAVMEAVTLILYEYTNALPTTIPDHPQIAAAVRAQQEIGVHLLPQGFLARSWTDVLEDFSVEHPDRKISGLLKAIWSEFTDQVWQCRNELAHRKDNRNKQVVEEGWAARLIWFLEHPLAIAESDRFLLDFVEEDIQRMSGLVRNRRVTQLETALRAFERERKIRSSGQRVITDFFKKLSAQKQDTTEINE